MGGMRRGRGSERCIPSGAQGAFWLRPARCAGCGGCAPCEAPGLARLPPPAAPCTIARLVISQDSLLGTDHNALRVVHNLSTPSALPAHPPIPHCTPHRAARSCHRRCLQGLPLGSGMGSSAASAAAGAWAVNALFGSPLGKDTLVYAGLASEAAVSGYHADNIAPALMGGFILIRCGLILDQLHTGLRRGQDPDHRGSIQPHPHGRLHADQVSRPLRRVW